MRFQPTLEQFVIPDDEVSPEKRGFLTSCAKKVHEALIIMCGVVPAFNPSLAESKSPISMHVCGSREYDAEIEPGMWCFVEGVSARKGINLHLLYVDRKRFSFLYNGQKFRISYGDAPEPTPRKTRRR